MAAPVTILFLLSSIAGVVRADWIYSTTGHAVCIHMSGTISANITTKVKDTSDVKSIADWQIDESESSCKNVSCSKGISSLSASLILYATEDYDCILNFTFTGNCKQGYQMWSLVNVTVKLYNWPISNVTDEDIVAYDDDGSDWFSTQFTRSYSCNAQSNYPLKKSNATDVTVTLITSNWQVQAFQFNNNGTYDNAQQCQQDSKGTVIIPIAVGVALGVLISVVVLAYVISWFVHRRKSGSYAALN